MIEAHPTQQDNTNATQCKWYDSTQGTLSLPGRYLRCIEFFTPLHQWIPIKQKVHP